MSKTKTTKITAIVVGGASGLPIPGADVTCTPDGKMPFLVTSDKNGHADFIVPVGNRYSLTAKDANGAATRYPVLITFAAHFDRPRWFAQLDLHNDA